MPRNQFDHRQAAAPCTAPRLYHVALIHQLRGCASILDVGCGKSSPARFAPDAHLIGLDAYAPDIALAKQAGTHDEFVKADALCIDALFAPRSFDACTALDVIEHFAKEDGTRLLDAMERVARKRVVVFTPNGFLPQPRADDADLQEHISGWTVDDFLQRGYRVYGSHGPKRLRGAYHAIRYRPTAIWAAASCVLQCVWFHRHPRYAAALLAVKDVAVARRPSTD